MFQIPYKKRIAKTITSASINPITLVELPTFSKPGYSVLNSYHQLKNVEIVNMVKSLPQVNFPMFPLELSQSEINAQILNLQWLSPRIHVDLLLGDNVLDIISILSPSPYPYAKIDVGNFSLGESESLKINIVDAGYGLLTGQDKLVVNCELESFFFVQKISNGTRKDVVVSNSPTKILNSNPDRLGFTIFNNSNNMCYIDITPTVSPTSYMVKLSPEAPYYESPINLTEEIYAISLESLLLIREF